MLVRSWNIMSGWTKHTTVHEFNALFPGLSKFNFLNRGETDLWKETSDYIVITSLFQITYLEVGDRTSGSTNRYRSVTIETALRSLLWSAESLDSNSQWGKRQRLMVHLDSPLNLQCYLLYHHSQVSWLALSHIQESKMSNPFRSTSTLYALFYALTDQIVFLQGICAVKYLLGNSSVVLVLLPLLLSGRNSPMHNSKLDMGDLILIQILVHSPC